MLRLQGRQGSLVVGEELLHVGAVLDIDVAELQEGDLWIGAGEGALEASQLEAGVTVLRHLGVGKGPRTDLAALVRADQPERHVLRRRQLLHSLEDVPAHRLVAEEDGAARHLLELGAQLDVLPRLSSADPIIATAASPPMAASRA